MSQVFVDTAYWIAMFRSDDQWREAALEAQQRLGDVAIITTDEVLTEFLTAVSTAGSKSRQEASEAVANMLANPDITVIPQSRDSFLKGVQRYRNRLDKGYSLQDCISMNVMEAEGITDILTSDHHFEQEGFNVLMKRSS